LKVKKKILSETLHWVKILKSDMDFKEILEKNCK